ncbi:MAG: hypothetical protein WCQ54_13520 [Clostridiaceae bacterium]
MKNKKVFMTSLVIMIIALICMGINRFVFPFPDIAIRVTGVIILVDLFVYIYSRGEVKRHQ